MLLETIESERKALYKKIQEMEEQVQKLKESKEKAKAENLKKTADMKEKLEKAFQQLTANDEAATELQKLRT